jgi:predicted methyltransferase
MTRRALVELIGLVALLGCATATAAIPQYVSAALKDHARPAADRERDADRKPGATLAFAGVRPGEVIIELIPGAGYYTRLLSKVVGPKGHVYALVPAPRPDAPPGAPDRAAAVKSIAADRHFRNVTVLVQPVAALKAPAKADLVWTSQNYHDVHNVPGIDLLAFNKAIYAALKPRGTYLVIDHAAAPNSPPDVTSTLHRIDPAVVKREVRAAGFVLVQESDVLRNSADGHDKPVFDPEIRGKTDQFMLKFIKPGR